LRVHILGSAAGGGFPQWNCGCSNCSRLRQGSLRGRPRTQAQLALFANGQHCYLLNASPDLRAQIESTPALQARPGARNSPIAAVILTSADADQVLGLFLLREFQPLRIFATASVRRLLAEDNALFRLLERVPGQSTWTDIVPGATFFPESGVQLFPIALAGAFPGYVSAERAAGLDRSEAVLGLMIESSSGRRMLYAPALPQITPALVEHMNSCDIVLLDGTFWSDDELRQARGSGPSAREIGHVPISGRDGSLAGLASVRRPRRIYIHLNNTNPVLDEASAEHRQVRDAGWEIAEDGWELEL
jgi:pyrroloquinoline quinone biosynthesis protein B